MDCSLPFVQDGAEEADGVDGEGADGQENGHYSDTTASANGSDDDDGDGSTAATDGSNLRASPAEHVSYFTNLLVLPRHKICTLSFSQFVPSKFVSNWSPMFCCGY